MIFNNLLLEINRRLEKSGKPTISSDELLVTISVLSALGMVEIEGKNVNAKGE